MPVPDVAKHARLVEMRRQEYKDRFPISERGDWRIPASGERVSFEIHDGWKGGQRRQRARRERAVSMAIPKRSSKKLA
jgi:hypothetical protein